MRYIFHQRVIFVYLGLLLSYHDFICGVVAQKNHSQNERNEEVREKFFILLQYCLSMMSIN